MTSSIGALLLSCARYLLSRPFRSGLIHFLVGLVCALVVGWIIYPAALYSKQAQPINFSHEIHIDPDIGIDGETETERCLYCHGFRDDGTFVGIPDLDTCVGCHSDPDSPMGQDAEEIKFLKEYAAKEMEIPWYSYYRQPDCVYFSHIAHVRLAGEACETCHGDHGKSKSLQPFEQNRITGYSRNIWGKSIAGWKKNSWDRMKMDDCSDCHARKGHPEKNACSVCHK